MANPVLTMKNYGAEPAVFSILAPSLSFTIPPNDSIVLSLPEEMIDKLISQNTKRGLTHISDMRQGFRGVAYDLRSA